MGRFKMIALTGPTPGQDEEYNRWYQDVHLPEIVSFPGMVSAQRFKVKMPLAQPAEYPYLAVYNIETDDFDSFMARLGAAFATGKMTASEASDNANAYTVIFEEFGEEVRHEDVKDRCPG